MDLLVLIQLLLLHQLELGQLVRLLNQQHHQLLLLVIYQPLQDQHLLLISAHQVVLVAGTGIRI